MIAIHDLTVRQGAFALDGITFEVRTGQYGVLMGRTGIGKTTLLEAICGLRNVAAGRIILMNRDVTRCKPGERGIGYVPQDRALFTNMTVGEHLSFALRIRKWQRSAIDQRVGELAELLGIGHLLRRRPHGLSGGEAQRVALGRALSMHPDVLLFDEPLSALDDDTREDMYELLRLVRERTQVTVLHVTHHRDEARRLADRILLLEDGKVCETSLGDRIAQPSDNDGRAGAIPRVTR